MINEVITRLKDKKISVIPQFSGKFADRLHIEMPMATVTALVSGHAFFTEPEPTTLEHHYEGGDLISCEVNVTEVHVYDISDNEVEVSEKDMDAIKKIIFDNTKIIYNRWV